MSRSDEVFAMFADANPVPVVAALEDRLDHLPVDLEGGSDMTNITELGSNRSDDAAGRSRPRGSGPRYLVAAAALVFGLIGGVWFLAEDRPIDLADPGVPIEERALAAVERHYAAVESGDIETVVALAGSEDVADARMWEFNSVLAKAGYPTIVEQCEATRGSDVLAYVRCTVTMDHPVFEAIGDTEGIAPFTFLDGALDWSPFEELPFSTVNAVFAQFVQANRPDDYERVCAPSAYNANDIIIDRGVALTPECAALEVEVIDDVAQWVRDGMPDS